MNDNTKTNEEKRYLLILNNIVKDMEEFLGRVYLIENRGNFWSNLETRPYMRAKATLVEAMISMGDTKEAIRQCESMLELNPTDNQNIRSILLGLYLEERNLHDARILLAIYDDETAVFNWSRVLERIQSGDLDGAEKALRKATVSNPYVASLLTGQTLQPKTKPTAYFSGSIDEADYCYFLLYKAWNNTPNAIEWLMEKINHSVSLKAVG
jgi:tetratricopeptide (TPR) repeat protein